jgi:hypothetical protein
MNCLDIEIAIAVLFGYVQNTIVPNVSWGAGLHECDMLIIRKSGHAIEVEIKVSKSDLKKDLTKRHGHKSARVKELYYAVPKKLVDYAREILPADVGLIECYPSPQTGHAVAWTVRPAKARRDARPFTPTEIGNVARLGTMRIWNLKRTVRQLKADLKSRPARRKPGTQRKTEHAETNRSQKNAGE